MGWETILGHNDQVALFRGILRQGRLGHAYLFVGPAGIGKKTFAWQLAQCLLCQKHPEESLQACGECPRCQQVRALTHPDFFMVGCPEGKRQLPIEVFLGPADNRGKAGLCYDLSHTPLAGRRKIAIINDANLMNDESGNALLKTLEEPPPHSLLILIATGIDGILPTIRSRCQIVRFAELSEAHIVELLLRTGMVEDRSEAVETAAFSDGSLDSAAQLLDPELRARRELLYDGLSAEVFNSPGLSQRVLEGVESAGSDASAQRQQAGWQIKFCVEFYRAALWGLTGADGGGGRTAKLPQAARFAKRFEPASPEDMEMVAELLDRSMLAEMHLEQNTGVNLCLETLFDELGRIIRAYSQHDAVAKSR